MSERRPRVYREMIDALVEMCRQGQGQVGPRWVRAGVWNRSATPEDMPDEHRMNLLLARLPADDREALAGVLADQVVAGVFETLKVLEAYGIEPFDSGNDETATGRPTLPLGEQEPFDSGSEKCCWEDFMGRMAGWEWPDA